MLSSSYKWDHIYRCLRYDFGHTLFWYLKSDLDFQQTHLWGQFVKQKLMLSSSYKCDQIYKYWKYDFLF